jgi:diacylglycerol kinase (ATP)
MCPAVGERPVTGRNFSGMQGNIVVIVNPAAGGGRAERMLPQLHDVFDLLDARFISSREPGDEERLARAAASEGAETIVAVGGDGTWSNVAQGVLLSGRSPRLALVAAGTGNDYAKTIGAPATDLAETARLITAESERLSDVGVAGDRAFLNCCGFGFDAAVLRRVPRIRLLRGAARYMAAAVTELISYRGERIAIEPWPDSGTDEVLLLVIANGRYYGGMFDIAPHARANDGILDAVRISSVRGARRVGLLLRALRGWHIGAGGVETHSAPAFTLRFDEPPTVNTDGELWRATWKSVGVRVLAKAIRIVAK